MEKSISTIEIVMCLSEAIDLINPVVANHHKYVASIAYQLSCELRLEESEKSDIVVASAIHDIGALTLKERRRCLEFEFEEDRGHSARGALLINGFEPFKNIAKLIKHHHTPWNNGKSVEASLEKILINSYLINLADRIAVLLKPNENILNQVEEIKTKIISYSGKMFNPVHVEAFLKLSKKESFWLDIITNSSNIFKEIEYINKEVYKGKYFDDIIKLLGRVIDFRSHFTATHTSGVAATAKAISELVGFTKDDIDAIEVAGYLHDLGKLAIPSEILEKKEKLTKKEFDIIRTHSYYTNSILKKVQNFDTIRCWASYHHENINGQGYPFKLSGRQISTGSRILSIADVFVALMEDRPYRKGLSYKSTFVIIGKMVDNKELDTKIVDVLKDNFEHINDCRIKVQEDVSKEYSAFMTS